MTVTNIAHQSHKDGIRHDNPTRTLDRFHNKCSDCIGPLECNFVLERVRDVLGQRRRIGFIERIAIGIGAWQMETPGHQGFVIDAETVVSVDRGSAKMRPMIPLFQRDKFCTGRLPTQSVILSRQPQTCFHRI